MAYFPYVDSRRKAEVIAVKFDLGKTNKEIAREMKLAPTQVSYYLKKQGRSRPRMPAKERAKVCIVCRKRPVMGAICSYVCDHADCIAVFLSTMECYRKITTKVGLEGKKILTDQETKIALEIQKKASFPIPPEAQVCMWNDVTKLFASVADHIRFHACKQYYYPKPRRPPTILWVNEEELRLYRMREREVAYARRNENSETPQPRRLRWAR